MKFLFLTCIATLCFNLSAASDEESKRNPLDLSIMHHKGIGVEIDNDKAYEYARIAADSGDDEALKVLAYYHRYGIGCQKDLYVSRNYYKLLADKGSAFAQTRLGLYHLKGWGCTLSEKTAIEIFKSNLNSDPHAYFWLGQCHLNGQTGKDEEQSLEKALECFSKCVESDDLELIIEGLYGYALTYKKYGYYKEALKCHEQVNDCYPDNLIEWADMLSAGQGCDDPMPEEALEILTTFINHPMWGNYRKGEAAVKAAAICWTLKREKEARQWLKHAAENLDYTDGMLQYAKVLMLNKQYNEGIYWFSVAAERGETEAMIELFKWYMTGGIVEKDEFSGLYWLDRLAEHPTLKILPEYEAWLEGEIAKVKGEATADPHPGDIFKDPITQSEPNTPEEHLALARHYLKAYDISVQLFTKHYTRMMNSGAYSDAEARKSAHRLCYSWNERQYTYSYNKAYEHFAKALEYYRNESGGYSDELIHSLAGMAKAAYLLDKNEEAADYVGQMLQKMRLKTAEALSDKKSQERKEYWDKWSEYLTDFVPSFAMDLETEKCNEYIYDAALFYKGLLLNYDKNVQKGNFSITWRDIRKNLKSDEVAIEFVKTHTVDLDEPAYIAVLITPQCSSPVLFKLFGEDPLEAILSEEEYYTTDRMYHIIWKPMEKYLKEAKKVYYSPDGMLYNIALESLPADGTTITGELAEFYRLSSTRELVGRTNDKKTYDDIALVGGVNFGERRSDLRSGVDFLEHSMGEVKEISDIYKANGAEVVLLTGNNATEKALNQVGGCDLLHLATHGYFWKDSELNLRKRSGLFKNVGTAEDDMLRSGLFLAGANASLQGKSALEASEDGILTANEISRMNLSDTDLVILSACRTALGKVSADGIYGLQRGFKLAGANSLLMTLWEVDDKATSILMKEFHKGLDAGLDKRSALEAARKYMRNTLEFSNPKYWAGFILLDAIN